MADVQKYTPVKRTPQTPMTTALRESQGFTDARVVADVADEINYLSPNATPLVVLTSKVRKTRIVSNWKFWFMEQDDYPRFGVVVSDGSTTITFQTGHGSRFPLNALLRCARTGEVMHVTTAAATTPTVTRGIGDTSEQTLVAGDVVEWFSHVSHEAATIGTIKSIPESEVYNYPQIIRTPLGVSGRAAQMELRGGSALVTETKKIGLMHRELLEKTFFFGQRDSYTDPAASGYLMTLTGGLDYFIGNNYVWDLGGNSIQEAAFFDWMAEFLRYGKGGYRSGNAEKVLLVPAVVMAQIDKFARDKIQTVTEEKVYGVKVRKLVSNLGTLNMFHAPALDEHTGNTLVGFGLDMNHIRKVAFRNRNTKLLKGREDNSLDGSMAEFFSDVGLEVALPEAHCKIVNISG